jgi:hypothetical protein
VSANSAQRVHGRDPVIYEITPKTFGLTNRLQLLLGLGTLACFVLPMILFPLIRASWAWTSREIVSGLLTWLFIEFCWYVQHNYSLEVDEDSVRVGGGRVVRKGHLRYVREINSRAWRGGPRLLLSERPPAWARLFGGVIVIPKGVPEYQQIKEKVVTWM